MKLGYKKFNKWLIFIFVLGLLCWVGVNIAFPSFVYSINKTDKFKISVLKEKIDGKNFLSLTPLYDYPYHTLEANINIEQGSEIGQDSFPVFYGYEAEFYPVSFEKIKTVQDLERYFAFNNETETSNGDLLSNNEAVFFISKGIARPFLGPEIFLRLGFDWDDVEKDEDGELSSLEKGERLSFTSPHPDGTILRFSDGKFFMVWEKSLIEIEELVSQQMLSEGSFIEVRNQEKTPAGDCKIRKKSSKKIVCKMEAVENLDATGHTYLLEIPEEEFSRITDAKIRLSMLGNFDFNVAKESLKRIKDGFVSRYKDDLLK